ncbi:MAG: hypothetical protein ACTS3F_10930 [Phycisphaerales bacterium]
MPARTSFQRLARRELPEAQRLPPGERWRLNEHIYRQQIGAGLAWMAPVACLLFLAMMFAPSLLARFNIPSPIAMVLIIVAGFTAQFIALAIYQKREGHRIVWKALNRCGCRTCPRCGYDCRNTEPPICPECGGSLEDAAAYRPGGAEP